LIKTLLEYAFDVILINYFARAFLALFTFFIADFILVFLIFPALCAVLILVFSALRLANVLAAVDFADLLDVLFFKVLPALLAADLLGIFFDANLQTSLISSFSISNLSLPISILVLLN